MEQLNFNSQVCTSIEQSKKLLSLGLKPETADMVLFKHYNLPQYPFDYTFNQDLTEYEYTPMVKGNQPFIQEGNIPAWSLHRLIEMLPYTITFRLKKHKITLYDICRTIPTSTSQGNTYYDALINAIEGLIDLGKFNKQYLNE